MKNCVLLKPVTEQTGFDPVENPSHSVVGIASGAIRSLVLLAGTVSGTTSTTASKYADGLPHPVVLTLTVTVPEKFESQSTVIFDFEIEIAGRLIVALSPTEVGLVLEIVITGAGGLGFTAKILSVLVPLSYVASTF